MPHPRRGEIHRVDFNPTRGSEQAGERPAVVVSNDTQNATSPVIVVVPITSKLHPKQFPQHVLLPVGRPLQDAGTILCNQIRTVSKERLKHHVADLSAQQLAAVEQALLRVLGIKL